MYALLGPNQELTAQVEKQPSEEGGGAMPRLPPPTHSYTVLIYAYIDEAAKALGERGFEEITAENVYYGRSERMAGYKFYTAVRAAMANPLAFSVALWRDDEVIARAKL
jgi:hypothetical protein